MTPQQDRYLRKIWQSFMGASYRLREFPQIDWAPGGTFGAAYSAVRHVKLRDEVRREYTALIASAARAARKDRLRPKTSKMAA